MTQDEALVIVVQALRDRKNWGEHAGIRVAQYELINALLALEGRFTREWVPKEELTLSHRRYAQLNAIHEKLKKTITEGKPSK